MRLTSSRSLFAIALFGALPLLTACPKKETPPPVVDAGPPPAPVDTTPTVIVPLEEDAGVDAGEDAGVDAGHKGPAVSTNVTRLKQCCGQLRTQAKALGASPEAGMLNAAAAQCDTTATQFGKSGGNAPELGVIKGLLAGRNIPAICSGF